MTKSTNKDEGVINMELTRFQFAVICGVKAFLACFQDEMQVEGSAAQTKGRNEPTEDSNGIPVCRVHKKNMKASTKREGQYYCTAVVGEKPDGGKAYCRELAYID